MEGTNGTTTARGTRPPIRLIVGDDLTRSRLTVGFRLLLAIPHLLWLAVWFYLAAFVAIGNWIATLISGEPSPTLHGFLASYARYVTHVVAYVTLAADPFPGFTGKQGTYPVDLVVDPPGRQNRWVTGFRAVLALPAIVLADAMLGFGTSLAGGVSTFSSGLAATVAVLAWFACLARGRMPRGFRNLLAYTIGYSAQVNGFLLLLTDRYPTSDPGVVEVPDEPRRDPIRMSIEGDLRRSRLTTFFRLMLAFPHFVWLVLWGVAAAFAVIGNWLAVLATARSPRALHRFLSAYLRYQTHVFAFVLMVGNPFPGFTGKPGAYPIDLAVDPPERQRRATAAFRLILAVPAVLVAGALLSLAYLAALYGWFASLARGRMPKGLRNLGAFALRYNAQAIGYTYLLTDRYPYSGPPVAAPWPAP